MRIKLYVDMGIGVNATLSIEKGHAIATEVHDLLERQLMDIKHCMVHIEPSTIS
ncbi:MAG: cation transporter dimerization domain-containing protein [Cellulosilyticaceae bacterium]